MPVKVAYPNLPDDFRKLVKNARLAKGYSIREMGRDLGIQPAAISQLERGDRNFSYDRAVQLRNYLNLDYDLPIPSSDDTQRVTRNRNKHPLERGDGFYLNVDGELIEVLTYRRLGSVSKATLIKERVNV